MNNEVWQQRFARVAAQCSLWASSGHHALLPNVDRPARMRGLECGNFVIQKRGRAL